MSSRLRISGRELLIGNMAIMTLFFAVGVMLIMCISMGMMSYEIYLRQSFISFSGDYISALDVAVALLLIFAARLVWLQIRLGADRYFFRLAQSKGGKAADIFYYFHPVRALSACLFRLKLAAVKLPALIAAAVPSLLCFLLLNSLSYGGLSSFVALSLAVGGLAFAVNGVLFYRRFTSLFFLADYIFISGEYVSFRQLLSLSSSVMKNESKSLLRLRRSFYGWFMLCIFLFPSGYVWNYYRQTLAVAAAKFLEE